MLGGMSAAPPSLLLPRGQLFGRDRERAALDRLLDGVRGGRGGVLVLYGEAGVGKTALLEYAAEAGSALRFARTVGVEAEMEIPFVYKFAKEEYGSIVPALQAYVLVFLALSVLTWAVYVRRGATMSGV